MKPPLEHSHSLPQTPAIVNERHRKIMALLHQQTSLSVSQLAHMLGVSEVTIRKDLTLLEQQQMLYRVHGSAKGPTTENELLRSTPPSWITVHSSFSASVVASLSDVVIAVSSSTSRISRAMASVVVPEAMRIVSRGSTSRAA